MNEVLTVPEIESRYDAEWVLLGDPVTNESLEVLSGTVLWHSKDRDEVYRKAIEIKPQQSAFLYTGRVGDGMEFAL